MLAKLTMVRVLDTTGVGWVQTFHLYGGSHRRWAAVGGFMKGAVSHITFYPKVRRGKRHRPLYVGKIVRGLITQARYVSRYHDGARCRFFFNAVVLLRRRGTLRSKLLHGPVSRNARRRAYEALFGGFV